jgi:hypothetical protein
MFAQAEAGAKSRFEKSRCKNITSKNKIAAWLGSRATTLSATCNLARQCAIAAASITRIGTACG